MNVLIADDNADDRRMLCYILKHHGCTVIEAKNGQEGLDLARRHTPDFIVSDALMPCMDGFQFLRLIKADPELSAIPFLFYSAVYTGVAEEKLALSLGAAAFVVKPTEPENLWKKICAITESCKSQQGTALHRLMGEKEEHFLEEYGRVVATKLEEKVHELEEALALRKLAEEELRSLNAELNREVAERRRAEKSLQEQEQELATIFENSPFVMLLLDGERRVRRVNDMACSFAASSIKEMIDRRSGEALRCLHALDSPGGCGFGPYCRICRLFKAITDTFETGNSHHQVEANLPINIQGEERAVSLLFSTTKVMVARQEMTLLTLQDISEKKLLEAQFRQAQKMESVGTLAGGIAHDFNNILTVITGYGQIALMEMSDDDPCRNNIEQMLAAADRAAYLTRDLLLFSRKQASDKKNIDLNKVVRSMEKFLLRVIGENISCKTELPDEAVPVFADAHHLEQVLMNLATNARDAMAKGGDFNITVETTKFDQEFITANGFGNPGMYAVIAVADTGSGMDEETRKHIFDPFFTTKEVGKGTGLGLSVIFGIVKDHDGFVNVSSEPGKGTTFRIYLPLIGSMTDRDDIQSNKEHSLASSGGGTILLAEDDETVRNMTLTLLENFGYEVIAAVDGEDAVQKFRENSKQIRLLLFDMIMPKKSGKESYEEILAVAPEIKVIFASGYATDPAQLRALINDNGNVKLISKPYLPADLLAMVRSMLDKETAASGRQSDPIRFSP